MKISSGLFWGTILAWSVADLAGLWLGGITAGELNQALWGMDTCPDPCLISNPVQWATVLGLCIGAWMGAAEWLCLRRLSLGWIAASMTGWAAGMAIAVSLDAEVPGLYGLVVGTLVGLMQWVVLRRLVQASGWWIAASAAAAFISGLGFVQPGFSIAALAYAPFTFYGTGFVFGLIRGVTMVLLIRKWS